MKTRGPWQGMTNIIQFNARFYLMASVVLVAALVALFAASHMGVKLASLLAVLGAGYFIFVSLGVSHLIYDRSDLYRWNWLDRALKGAGRKQSVYCHSGLDEASEAIRERTSPDRWITLDHFDAVLMTEPSIHRARQLYPPTPETIPSTFDTWPVEAESTDVIFGLLAIHEFRSEDERGRWFREALRCLRPGGRIVIVEHLRNGANFLAFGPGFRHFHSAANWKRCWESAGLRAEDEFPITPWLRTFVLVRP
ncbi:class I SAM-dependent methyltransferase [Luteolibacter luteus]|uniref:Class I SAM-dependent methyltransferase n=1 Tax=Luteolibacter luteus TaxID=2728835 RepID=A0A858RMK0_9BACT|nr:class I SAM-dependent methyltransferase [Luteolibacter luteus]QJE97935.1 class I SAM-dependent methyltransferase [Luteolibacter luteus]